MGPGHFWFPASGVFPVDHVLLGRAAGKQHGPVDLPAGSVALGKVPQLMPIGARDGSDGADLALRFEITRADSEGVLEMDCSIAKGRVVRVTWRVDRDPSDPMRRQTV